MTATLAFTLNKQIDELRLLVIDVLKKKTFPDKIELLNDLSGVKDFHPTHSVFLDFLKGINPAEEYAIKSIIAIDQAPVIFNIPDSSPKSKKQFRSLINRLVELEEFYRDIGGIIGYHLTVLSLIEEQCNPPPSDLTTTYLHPEGLYLDPRLPEVHSIIRKGMENLDSIVEMYPIGGAGDRLNLKDPVTDNPLPMALLPFIGRSLLEGLIRDIQAQEYLYFKIFKKRITIPAAFMTSDEKNNHAQIFSLFKNRNWFGRPPESLFFFKQPSVPIVTVDGKWSVSSPLELNVKPSGHGVIWKLAEEQGLFDRFEEAGKQKCLVRQINNPIGGIDCSVLALIGAGSDRNKSFGFVSCERHLKCEEGANVVTRSRKNSRSEYCLTNIEYTDFTKHGIDEIPAAPGSIFSLFPANTNILFADIPAIRRALKTDSIPGKIVNLKSKFFGINDRGEQTLIPGGRLESTMQNIADAFIDSFDRPLTPNELQTELQSFIVYNDRLKTISATKKSYVKGESPLSTPEQAFHDLLLNHYTLLKTSGFELPLPRNFDEMLTQGPSCMFLFHPALGPLFSVIRQKIRNGRIHENAELQLEIAEADIEDLDLNGSLLIEATSPIGISSSDHFLDPRIESRCTLKNVKIENKGIDRIKSDTHWKNTPVRSEALQIVLHEGSEFSAENVTIKGNRRFEVPPRHRLTLVGSGTEWTECLVPIREASWTWHYDFDSRDAIRLERKNT